MDDLEIGKNKETSEEEEEKEGLYITMLVFGVTIVSHFKLRGPIVWMIFNDLGMYLSMSVLLLQAAMTVVKLPEWMKFVGNVTALVALVFMGISGGISFLDGNVKLI